MHKIFTYIPFAFMVAVCYPIVLVLPSMKEARGYQNAFGNGINHKNYRAYMDAMKIRDAGTYYMLIIGANMIAVLIIYAWFM